MDLVEQLFRAAASAQQNAYAPYSKFKVGAAVQGRSGAIYSGGNVENAAYPVGTCAEQAAIAAMVRAGERSIAAILVLGDGELPVTPCGGCRQRIREFAGPDTPIHIAGPQGWRATHTLNDLLPESFGPDNLTAGNRGPDASP